MAEKKSSPWIWISLILIIAGFAGFILFLDQKIVKNAQQSEPAKPQVEETAKPKFDFYTVLPGRTVDIPEPENNPMQPNATSSNTSATQQYILQAGSFKQFKDADRQKAELAMLGLQARISSAEVNGETYHRVEMGPFGDGGALSSTERNLISNDIQFIRKAYK